MISSIFASGSYKSPFGSSMLQENISNKILNDRKEDSFIKRNSEKIKKAGTAVLVSAGLIASVKNRGRISGLIKKLPEIFSKKK